MDLAALGQICSYDYLNVMWEASATVRTKSTSDMNIKQAEISIRELHRWGGGWRGEGTFVCVPVLYTQTCTVQDCGSQNISMDTTHMLPSHPICSFSHIPWALLHQQWLHLENSLHPTLPSIIYGESSGKA